MPKINSQPTFPTYLSTSAGFFLAGLSLGVYLFWSSSVSGPGFPLDDGWIHQTYARNLAEYAEWSYWPGEPSAGSTAPLWSALLAVGHRIHLAPYTWVYVLGGLCLGSLALLAGLTVCKLAGGLSSAHRQAAFLFSAAFIALEWHLAWAAGSGMETLLAGIIVLAVLRMLLDEQPHWLRAGLLAGAGVWVRPDVLTVLGPLLLVLFLGRGSSRDKIVFLLRMAAGFLSLFVPYLVFYRLLAGTWWPNTFYAKQAEYAVELQEGLFSRFIELGRLPLVGAGVLLLPGFIWIVFSGLKNKNWPSLAGSIWVLGYLALYALRLPVTYQYGRYLMPMMPVYFVWGLAGMVHLAASGRTGITWRVLLRAWLLSVLLTLLAFWLRGAQVYSRDVALINSEMVATAKWVAAQTPVGSLVAAHDIGALGYFGQRRLLDLAGLISPEVIPFIRDEVRLAEYLDHYQADYLVTFPGWYPQLTALGQLVYRSDGRISPELGGENMAVYRWRLP